MPECEAAAGAKNLSSQTSEQRVPFKEFVGGWNLGGTSYREWKSAKSLGVRADKTIG